MVFPKFPKELVQAVKDFCAKVYFKLTKEYL